MAFALTRVLERPVAASTEAEREVVVAFWAVKFWSVVEELVKVWAPLQKLFVVVPKPREITLELKRIGKVAETVA